MPFLSALATAQAITGRVVTPLGAGLPGVNIDCFDLSGDELDLLNDGTDANGNFTTTVVNGAGVYNFVFFPPSPPVTTHLVAQRNSVVVVTTTNLGTITLQAGVLLSGRAVTTGNVPVANVNVNVIDGLSGAPILNAQNNTNAFGQFNLAVPTHAWELQLDASDQVLASRAFERNPTGPVAMGDIFLAPGALVTGHLQTAGGAPISGVDLDFTRTSNGAEPFVPNDNTNGLGDFAVVVALGTYDIEFCPSATSLFVTNVLSAQTISTTTNLGNVTMASGHKLFGTVTRASGAPAAGVDVDVFHSVTGVKIPTCRDNTDALGAYSVVVPTGTYEVVFRWSGSVGLAGADVHPSVTVAAQTTLNGQLPLHSFVNGHPGP